MICRPHLSYKMQCFTLIVCATRQLWRVKIGMHLPNMNFYQPVQTYLTILMLIFTDTRRCGEYLLKDTHHTEKLLVCSELASSWLNHWNHGVMPFTAAARHSCHSQEQSTWCAPMKTPSAMSNQPVFWPKRAYCVLLIPAPPACIVHCIHKQCKVRSFSTENQHGFSGI